MTERCRHTTRLVDPKSCSLCIGAVPRRVDTSSGVVTIDGEPVRPVDPIGTGRMTYYSQRGAKARALRKPQ